MNYTGCDPLNRLRLVSRNEGKIKSYESCSDLRAWSHDIQRKDNYLREWIKTDMPVNVIPVSALIFIVKKMTWNNKGKTTPRCHPRCKSKVVLESICKSCNEMKQCFRNEEDFDKYFQDEEFETSHWPCETCLEALKTIKMFWSIIIEKLFKIKMTKTDNFAAQTANNYTDCVRCVAKVWQTEMIQQALFVKNITHYLNRNCFPWRVKSKMNNCSSPYIINLDKLDDFSQYKDSIKSLSRLNLKSSKGGIGVKFSKNTDTRGLSNTHTRGLSNGNSNTRSLLNANTNTRRLKLTPSHSRRFSRQTLSRQKTADVGCECTNLSDEIAAIRVSLSILKEKSLTQDLEIEKLTKENTSLKAKLQNVYKSYWWNSGVCTPSTVAPENICNIENLPKPFEACEDNKCYVAPIKPIDSEIIITMKNCKNESYKHISLLQVLHKSNASELKESDSNASTCKKEDPLVLLAKLQNKFGAIVNREMNLVNRRNGGIDVDADYHTVNSSRSDPSCSRSNLTNSDSGSESWFDDNHLTVMLFTSENRGFKTHDGQSRAGKSDSITID